MITTQAPPEEKDADRSESACGRCGGPAGPSGAWCDRCIAECRSYSQQLDLQRLPEFNTEPLDWSAIFYARAGIPVFPLTPGTKIPLARSKGVHDATTDLRVIRSWWGAIPAATSALHPAHCSTCSTSTSRTAGRVWSRSTSCGALACRGVWGKARTPTGGLHLLFSPSGAGCPTRLSDLGVDYKGKGGYMVAAPSVTESGVYQWETVEPDRRGGSRFDYPAAKRVLGVVEPTFRAPKFAPRKENAEGLIKTVAESTPGTRNDRLHWAACRCVQDGIDPEILRERARSSGLSDTEISSTLASAARTVRNGTG
jgi:Bifunctional DNA primase/polymerase, N-terminal